MENTLQQQHNNPRLYWCKVQQGIESFSKNCSTSGSTDLHKWESWLHKIVLMVTTYVF